MTNNIPMAVPLALLQVSLLFHLTILCFRGTHQLAERLGTVSTGEKGESEEKLDYLFFFLAGYLMYSLGIGLLSSEGLGFWGHAPFHIYTIRLFVGAFEINGKLLTFTHAPSHWLKAMDVGTALLVVAHTFIVLP